MRQLLVETEKNGEPCYDTVEHFAKLSFTGTWTEDPL